MTHGLCHATHPQQPPASILPANLPQQPPAMTMTLLTFPSTIPFLTQCRYLSFHRNIFAILCTFEIYFKKLTVSPCYRDVMKNLSFVLEMMGNFGKATIKMGNITGVIVKLSQKNQTNMNFAFTENAGVKVRCLIKERDTILRLWITNSLMSEAWNNCQKNHISEFSENYSGY